MTQTVYLVYRSRPDTGGVPQVDGTLHVIVNADSTANATANAVLACNQSKNVSVTSQNSNYTSAMETDYTSNPSDAFDANYFDTVVAISAGGGEPGSGNLSANGDAYVFPERSAPVFVAGTSYTPVS
jgi:hypothetical protein